MRVGFGYDIHPLVPDRRFVLGGVEIPCKNGLLGHSDADVLCHALADALLGAAAIGDIGEHFPDTDPKYKGASSISLLREVGALLRKTGFEIINVDVTVVAEAPKLSPYKKTMAQKLSVALKIMTDCVSIKATTNEGFDAVGRGEAVAAYAVASLRRVD